MPWLRVIAAVVQSNEALDLKGSSESVSLPQGTELSGRGSAKSTCSAESHPVQRERGVTHDSPCQERKPHHRSLPPCCKNPACSAV